MKNELLENTEEKLLKQDKGYKVKCVNKGNIPVICLINQLLLHNRNIKCTVVSGISDIARDRKNRFGYA